MLALLSDMFGQLVVCLLIHVYVTCCNPMKLMNFNQSVITSSTNPLQLSTLSMYTINIMYTMYNNIHDAYQCDILKASLIIFIA